MKVGDKSVLLVMMIGFALVILLLVAAAGVSVHHALRLQQSIELLSAEQQIAAGLVEQLQVQRAQMSGIFSRLLHHSELSADDPVFHQLDQLDEALEKLRRLEEPGERGAKWGELLVTARDFSRQARQITFDNRRDSLQLEPLFVHHQRVMHLTEDLTLDASRSAMATEQTISNEADSANRTALGLLAACFVLSILCAVVTVRFSARAMQTIEDQASDLGRVSWQLLRGQEESARRFSHELHDELGQSLMAVKANIASMTADHPEERRAESLSLVDDCIANVRSLSQLLHPVVLDDFGLAAALRWLCDGFSQRTQIPVECRCTFDGRLAKQLETNVFRITQEALTNIARHSGASAVSVELSEDSVSGVVVLRLCDDGKGFSPSSQKPPNGSETAGIGLAGMRARALDSHGTIEILSTPGKGTEIIAKFPMEPPDDEYNTEDSYFAGRRS